MTVAVPLPPYMTFIKDRKPQFKLHDTIGPAKGGITYHVNKIVPGRYYNPKVEGADCDMVAYELSGMTYQVLWEVPKGTLEEDLPWKVKRKKPYVPPVSTRKCSHPGCTCNN